MAHGNCGAGRAEQRKSHEREESKTVQRKQKTGRPDFPTEDRVEPEKPQEEPSAEVRETANGDSATMTNRYLEMLGFPDILKWYEELRERDKRLEMLHVIC
jgi:hypothetical protein